MAQMALAVTPKMKSVIGIKRSVKGFTLIELLVVMFIIAIVTSIAILALGDMGKSRKAGYFAEQLKSTLTYAQGYAVVQPTTVIFQIKDNHYQFNSLRMIAHDNGSLSYRWSRINNPGSREDTIPSYLAVQVSSPDNTPIHINSNGTMTPFSINITIPGESTYYLLTGNEAGALTLTKGSSDNT